MQRLASSWHLICLLGRGEQMQACIPGLGPLQLDCCCGQQLLDLLPASGYVPCSLQTLIKLWMH